MEYELKTNRGLSLKFQSDHFSPQEYIAGLNEEKLLTVAIGNMVTQKSNIQSISPVYPEGTEPTGEKIKIYTNLGEIIPAYVESFDAGKTSAALNDGKNLFILLGEVIVHKHNANLIMPAQQ